MELEKETQNFDLLKYCTWGCIIASKPVKDKNLKKPSVFLLQLYPLAATFFSPIYMQIIPQSLWYNKGWL